MKRYSPAVLALTAVTVLAFASFAAAAGKAGALPTGPDVGDQSLSPFYRWTGALPKAPGQSLREEPLPAKLSLAHAGEARRMLYTSTDWRWRSGQVPVSGVLYLPQGQPPAGGWPIVAWAHGTLGVADACAPSWMGTNGRDGAYIDFWLKNGYAVAATDYQGLGGPGPHPYLLWQAEGRSVLDSIRAALKTEKRLANTVVITGQSQGSGAALGAASLARSYAPELNIKGVIATALITYMPDASAAPEAMMPGGRPDYYVLRMIGGSLPDGGPSAQSLLTEKGKLIFRLATSGCDYRDPSVSGEVTFQNAFTAPLERINALMGPAGLMPPFKTAFPIMLGTGLADTTIDPARQALTMRKLCAAGNAVTWKRYPGAAHGDTLTRSEDDALAFVQSALSGAPAQSNC